MIAVGSPRATSLANDGPLSAPMRGAKPLPDAMTCDDHFGHPQKRGLFQSFGCAHEQHRRLEVRQHLLKQRAAMLRRHDADHDFGAVQSFLQTAGGRDRCRDGLSGKEQFVHATGGDRLANFFLVRPEANL